MEKNAHNQNNRWKTNTNKFAETQVIAKLGLKDLGRVVAAGVKVQNVHAVEVVGSNSATSSHPETAVQKGPESRFLQEHHPKKKFRFCYFFEPDTHRDLLSEIRRLP